MSLTIKQQIVTELQAQRLASGYPSDAAFARSIKITPTDYSLLVNMKWMANPQLISEEKWATVARSLDFQPGKFAWNTANTVVFDYMTAQLELAQQNGMTRIFCDLAGIGKTHTCEQYAKTHRNAYYINCSDHPTKNRLIRELATVLGLKQEQRYEDTFENCMYYINTLEKPLLILDEAGDLDQGAILLIKRLYNRTEYHLGMYMVGARGLERKMDTGVRLKKNGYEEVFSRFRNKFGSILERQMNSTEKIREQQTIKSKFMKELVEVVCRANGITKESEIAPLQGRCKDLRDLRDEFKKREMVLSEGGAK